MALARLAIAGGKLVVDIDDLNEVQKPYHAAVPEDVQRVKHTFPGSIQVTNGQAADMYRTPAPFGTSPSNSSEDRNSVLTIVDLESRSSSFLAREGCAAPTPRQRREIGIAGSNGHGDRRRGSAPSIRPLSRLQRIAFDEVPAGADGDEPLRQRRSARDLVAKLPQEIDENRIDSLT